MSNMKKILFATYMIFLKILFYVNHRIYMRFFLKYLKLRGCQVTGTPRYIGVHVKFDNYSNIKIGHQTTISDECHLLTHDYSITNVMRANGVQIVKDIALERQIEIGNNVFIGKKSIIMPNAKIGDNVIIGAGSVVRGTVPPNAVWCGNPAQCISSTKELYLKWVKYMNDDIIRTDR